MPSHTTEAFTHFPLHKTSVHFPLIAMGWQKKIKTERMSRFLKFGMSRCSIQAIGNAISSNLVSFHIHSPATIVVTNISFLTVYLNLSI